MSSCWAAVLGGCSTKISGEHYISKSQYGDAEKITVQGFSWCPEPKEIGIGSAVANILCKTHNEALSPVDAEAKRVLDGLTLIAQRNAQDLKRRGEGISPTAWPSSVFLVHGELFERWLLKTTINLALMGQPQPRGGIFDAAGNPDRRYVEIAFGLGRFDPPEGFSWVAKLGETVPLDKIGTVGFVSMIHRETGALVGAGIPFHGNRLWLAAKGAPEIRDALRHVRQWKAKGVEVKIKFTWPVS
jgi:hypothetical protein